MTIRPLDDRVLIKPTESEEKTAGGIVLPDSAKEKPQQGTVVARGLGKLLDSGERGKLSVKKGDKVLYGKFAGTEVTIDGKDMIIMKESDLLATLG